jgi:transcriptional regulator with XRE-family HTH domain
MMFQSGTARQLREKAGLSRGDVAQEAGVPEGVYGRWERQERLPRADVAERLYDIFENLAALDPGVLVREMVDIKLVRPAKEA